ncbi:HemK2/MTQ2 family protein methyltransferase [Methanomassiliicoccus luminyensis]|uniref:HemK2/MTQ2 family protein methyltransferase n=1 Tax=Methanomassiliicoccus luminyensis TaxID=1080712 RepID=UPI0004747D24|nr:HemK2/MTQ2 family protein methyltransferase [Methanomassiliicoccus luminyensis]
MKYDAGIDITECEGVYPPAEDTFLLLDCIGDVRGMEVLEMGCGTGLISCHVASAGACLTAADINPKAAECTRRNLERNRLPGKVVLSDLFSGVRGRFDLILFNPPYLAVEEEGDLELAWAGGRTGVEVLARFLEGAPERLRPNGKVLLLLSSEMETESLDRALAPFPRRRVGTRRVFFEELWVEEIAP